MTDDLTCVTFGTRKFSQARRKHLQSFTRFGCNRVLSFDENSLVAQQARSENPEIFTHKRGYGYWLWKPYVIEAAMDATAVGSPILYTDIALELVASIQPLLIHSKGQDVCVFRNSGGALQRCYTKRDAFILMDADSPEFWNDEMVCGTYILFHNTEKARAFVRQWKRFMRDPRILTDVSGACELQEFPDFVAHRHDQSILSILATKHKLPIFADPSQFGRTSGRTQYFPQGSPRYVDIGEDGGPFFNLHRGRDIKLRHRVLKRVRSIWN